MKILVMGDLHGHLERIKKKIPKQNFDFIIGVGDYSGIDEWTLYWRYVFRLKKGTKMPTPKEFFGREKFKKILKKDFEAGKETLSFLNNLGKSGFFVFGNGDDGWYKYPFSNKKFLGAEKKCLNFLKKIKNIKEMTYKVKVYKGISFLGFGGYLDSSANNKIRDKKWQKAVNKRIGKAKKKMNSLIREIGKKSIFILHYPPYGVFDKISDKKNRFHGKHVGIDFFRNTILKKKPLLVLCGHMHEYVGKKKLGNSWVVNPGEGSKGKFAIVDLDEDKWKIKSIKFIK